MNCSKCSYELFKDFKFCYECGVKIDNNNEIKNAGNLSKLKCSECSSLLYNDAKFCHNCGKDVTLKTEPKNKSKDILGWLCVILAFVYAPIGTIIAFILSIYLLTRKDNNKTLAWVGLAFSSGILFLLFVVPALF